MRVTETIPASTWWRLPRSWAATSSVVWPCLGSPVSSIRDPDGTAGEGFPPQAPAHGAPLLNGPVGVGQAVLQRLGIGLHRLGQARQRCALRFGQQPQEQLGDLVAVPHVVKDRSVVGTILVDARHGRRRVAYAGHAGLRD